MNDEKTYFSAGDIVELKQDIPNKPKMLVIRKETSVFKHKKDEKSTLLGIRCRWFTDSGQLQEAVYNTKDLQIVK